MRVAFVFTFLLFGSFVRTQSDEDIDGPIVNSEDRQENKLSKQFEENLKCSELEEYSRCNANPSCERTCENFNKDSMVESPCFKLNSCIEGCVCKKDHMRLPFNGHCVHHTQCEIYKKNY
ncbi:uncharacterized protein [Chelonus insularis]|uniref:uncharacterized protein n=1 Tax=Chelonus insularis TaxID=460826 RepID=UPI001588DEB9|nr:uncharacterized protein LOC118069646 [Chelonus insularis]